MKRLMAGLVFALGLTCAIFPVAAQQGGGGFVPTFAYTIAGNWAFTGTNTHTGTESFTGTTSVTSPTLTTPVLSGSVTGTYTLAGTPTITSPAITSPVTTGKPTTYSTVTTYTGATDAIDFSLGDVFMLSRAGAADAATLADPAVGDNGRIIRIMSGTAFAHTITSAGGIGGAGTSDDVITFTNRIAASVTLFAHNGKWYVVGAYLAAIA